MSESFFQKVTTRADRERVFTLITEHQVEVLAVSEDKTNIKMKPKFLTGHKLVLHPTQPIKSVPSGVCVVTFSLGNEKYFMKTALEGGRGEDLHLDMQSDLFKLQRRNSFRLNIPSGYIARIELKTKNQKPVKEKYDLVDFSGGGFAFELASGADPLFKKDDTFVAKLTVGPDFSEDVDVVVRHCRMVGSQGSGLVRVGCEYVGIKAAQQNELIKLAMNLHREMFSKFKIGTR